MKHLEAINQSADRDLDNPRLLWMAQNTNHLALPSPVLRAMHESIDRDELHGYAPSLGFEALRKAIVRDVGVDGLSAIVTDGGAEALYHVCHTFLRPGDHFVTTEPGWKWPPLYARAIGADVVEIPVYSADCHFHLMSASLQAAVTERTRLIYLVDPNNPLGSCVPEDEMIQIVSIARQLGAVIVHDCTYCHFAEDHVLAAAFYPEGTITIYSFSKWLGIAGLRVGAAVGAPNLMEQLAAAPPNSLGCNVLSQRAALAGLECKPDWFPQVQRVQRRNQAQINEAVARISGLDVLIYPSNGNYMVIECIKAGIAPTSIVKALREQGILVRSGDYHTPRFGHRFFKVSTTVPEAWADQFCSVLPEVVARLRDQDAHRAVAESRAHMR